MNRNVVEDVDGVVGLRSNVTRRRLHVPRAATVVHRPRLVDHLVAQRAVTLVTAPAGSGKTVLATDWAVAAVNRGESVAWLSLEEGDDHPFHFWSAVLAALQQTVSEPTHRRLNALSPPMRGHEPQFIHALCDVLVDEPTAPWIVLDDAHRLTHPDVLAGLNVMLSRAESAVRVIMLGRSAPALHLDRLLIEGSLCTVTAPDMAFTVEEAGSLFELVDSAVTPDQVEQLVTWTEGWAAGLRLATLSNGEAALAALPRPSEVADRDLVFSYLSSEVLRQLPVETKDFLVTTSPPVELSADLAAALSGRPDAGEILEQLCQANVLTLRCRPHGNWYRYHSLLREYLLQRLAQRDADLPARQHGQAARWFAAHDEPVSAIVHARLARDTVLTFELVRLLGLRLVLAGRGTTVLDAVGLPNEASPIDPHVGTITAIAALEERDLATADEWLAVLARTTLPPGDITLTAMYAAARVHRSLLGGNVAEALAETALLDTELTGEPETDLLVHIHRGPARLRLGDVRAAIADLEVALALARRQGYDQLVLECLSQMSGMAGSICDFPATFRWSRQAISFATARGWADSPRLAYAYLLASWTSFQTGDDANQTRLAELGVRALEGSNSVEIEMGVRSMYALARFEQGTGISRVRAAEAFHALWQQPAAELVSPFLLACASPQELRALLSVGRMDAAEQTVRQVEQLLPGSAEALTLRALLLAAGGDVNAALRRLSPVLEEAVSCVVPTTLVLAQVNAACFHLRQNSEARALEIARRSLQWAAPNGFRRPYQDCWRDIGPLLRDNPGRFGIAEPFVSGLVTKFRHSGSGGSVDILLSRREQDVLDDLPSGMTVVDIAASQRVSPNTVKTHLRNLYTKLGVASRGEAIRAARARGLL